MPFIRDEKGLERVAGEMAFLRGKSYYQKGAVKTIGRKDNFLEGVVQGSEPEPFHVRILIKGLDNFRLAECTCPFKLGVMCKHSAAVLMHWIQYVAITENIDVGKMILLDEKQLKLNSQIAPLPQRILPQIEKPVVKKIKKPSYLLPEYQYRSPLKPRIQILLSLSGFIGGVIKSIPFKIYVINGEEKFAISNLKVLINSTRTRNINYPQFSSFTPMQQYVLNFLNELLTVDAREGGFTQTQFRIKRMQWAVYLGVIASCPGVEFIDSKTNQLININAKDKLTLTLRLHGVEKDRWALKASLKDPKNPQRDFKTVHIQEGHPVWIFDEALSSFQSLHESITYPFLMDFLEIERILDTPQIPYFISSVLNPLKESCEIIEEGDLINKVAFVKPSLRCRLDLDYVKDSVRGRLSFLYENQESYPYEGNACM
ncbi:MAG: hypothetical protein HQL15_10590, partial [Candidatus Omnitrophica bacterium]|nr:hypothetical protein [Candidatus Omnitrophota bacterium]